jgi:hypothetical protein
VTDAKPAFDLAAAHKYFAGKCFNQAWDLIDKKDRTAKDNELMAVLCHASIFHWLQRPDCTDQNLSIGYWQASRVQTLLGHAEEARRLAELCLSYSSTLQPFYLGYAHEAVARAASLAGDGSVRDAHLKAAGELAAQVTEASEREMLTTDLESLRS